MEGEREGGKGEGGREGEGAGVKVREEEGGFLTDDE